MARAWSWAANRSMSSVTGAMPTASNRDGDREAACDPPHSRGPAAPIAAREGFGRGDGKCGIEKARPISLNAVVQGVHEKVDGGGEDDGREQERRAVAFAARERHAEGREHENERARQ